MVSNEVIWRLGMFFSVLILMQAWEISCPARSSPLLRRFRWPGNVGLVVLSALLAKLVLPMGVTGVAWYAQQHGIGLFAHVELSAVVTMIISVAALDCAIYWQHRLFHRVPTLWKLHRVHHADCLVDTTTGFRFHPLEIVLSLLFKVVIVLLLGVPAEGVLIFEIMLNGFALFNHANVRIPQRVDDRLAWVIITQRLHRIHHSQKPIETDSNFGFSVSWWDRVFGTYTARGYVSDEQLPIGLTSFPASRAQASLPSLLTMPFVSKEKRNQ
ncbi:sterol desaturase family protein [Thaumasiovibrio sp. DFM-14]|uniref:sterol desaturase family protein n=1 Tax=Thaumasiovibrio sp. DFM-14 TaxID=3384792 RepID=UPI0039A0BC1C